MNKLNKQDFNLKYLDKRFILEGFSPLETSEKIIEYSTIPGNSRYHWETDIDIIDGAAEIPKKILVEQNYVKGGVYSNLKVWIDANSERFGFYLVYDNNPIKTEFKYEPCHYTYKPLSKSILK